MNIIPYFDYCALIITLFIIFSNIYRGLYKNRANKYFLIVLGSIALSSVFDVISIFTENNLDTPLVLKQISHSGYLITHSVTAPLYLLFIIATSDTLHLFKRHKIHIIPFCALYAIEFISVIITPFTGFMFYFNEAGEYVRNSGLAVCYGATAVYLLATVFHLFLNRKLYTKIKLLSLLSIVPLMLLAVVIQFFMPNYCIEIFSSALACMFINTFIQRPEETIDIITGVHNFTSYAQDMHRAFKNKKLVDIILINITNFRSLQEILTFDGVNEVLKLLTERLTIINKQLKLNANIYRLDHGRFRLVIERNGNNSLTEHAAETINAALKPKIPLNGMELNIVACICVAKCPEEIHDFDSLIAFGNDLGTKYPYTGKVTNTATIFDQSRYNIINELDRIIESAVAENKFQVYYQPIYSTEENRFVSAEALLRLYDDRFGFISPELFIPTAEKSGAIHKIGLFVLEEVCKLIASDEFTELGLNYIEVNLSVVQCMQSGLAEEILKLIDKYHITSDKINLEITESAASQSQSVFFENLDKLTAAGFSFSLDDYGTGYSNMKRMATLPLKIIKLDKTFVKFDDNPKILIILRNTVKMIKDMGIEIVVEGIETEEMLKCFSDMKCDFIQGYYFSKPIPRNDFITYILNHIGSSCRIPAEINKTS